MFAISKTSRHIFFGEVPRRPLRVVNLGSIPLRYIGQTVAETPSVDRLQDLPVQALITRFPLAFMDPANVKLALERGIAIKPPTFDSKAGIPAVDASEEELKVLLSVMLNPNSREIDTLSLADGFFTGPRRGTDLGSLSRGPTTVLDYLCNPPARNLVDYQRLGQELGLLGIGKDAGTVEAFFRSVSNDPFFCPPSLTASFPPGAAPFGLAPALYFKVGGAGRKFSDVRLEVENGLMVMEALKDYPFPSPISVVPGVWYYTCQKDLVDFIHQPMLIDYDLARLWITVATVQYYNEMAALAMHQLKKEAKDEKLGELLGKIGLAVTFAVITAGLALALAPLFVAGSVVSASAVAGGVTQIMQTAISIDQRKQAAQGMADAAKAFSQNDPAFAKEVQHAADVMDAQAAAAQAAAPPDAATQAAIAEQAGQTPITPANTPVQAFTPPPAVSPLAIAGIGTAGVLGLLFALTR